MTLARRIRGLATGSLAALALSTAQPGLAQANGNSWPDRSVLPIAPRPFAGQIERSAATSTPDWPVPVTAPRGAPNVLVVMTDDIGFGTAATFGGPIPTPNLDRLAATGVRYNNFHTTAMCSPTRAALLTGRNQHMVGSGGITDIASGYPGYSSVIPRSAATVARVLRDNGFSTAMFGKHHNIPRWEATLSGPFDHWPTGLGFEYFLGFIIGDTNQWQPRLFRNTVSVDTPKRGDPLDHLLVDDAIHWLHQQKATTPDKPFFLYLATGTGHGPHQAPADWIAQFKGRFDGGWDALRAETFARQKRRGIIPVSAQLTPRPAELPAWSSLTPVQQRLFARYMEVFAGMIAYQDEQVGRLMAELERMGQLDDTLVIFVEGDNGASGEGGPTGTLNEIGHRKNGLSLERTPEQDLRHLDEMGGPLSYPLYPAGWGWALNTPFPWMKQIASHLGGIRNGLVVRWPGHTRDDRVVRDQFVNVTDIVPTILQATGVPAPTSIDGVAQQRIDGQSFVYTLGAARASPPSRVQYFEMLGNRGIYKDGWFANTVPRRAPWERKQPAGDSYADYGWELYDLTRDFSQSRDLAAANPAKLREMQDAFLTEAQRNQVLPIDDKLTRARLDAARDHYFTDRSPYTYWGKSISVAEDAAPDFAGRGFTIAADIATSADTRDGPVVARGSRFGGWSFYLKDGRPTAYVARSEWPEDQVRVSADRAVPIGPARLEFAFTPDKPERGSGGAMCFRIDGAPAGCGRVARAPAVDAGQGETFDIGLDTGAPVTDDYPDGVSFGGEVRRVTVTLAKGEERP